MSTKQFCKTCREAEGVCECAMPDFELCEPVCLGCGRNMDADCGCPAGTGWAPIQKKKREERVGSVLQDWVMELPLRAQGTILTGIRGCDLAPKNPYTIVEGTGCSTGESTPERHLVAYLRFLCLNPADPREVDIPGAWFQSQPPEKWKPSQFGHYPQHWYAHLMHCFEVVAYLRPGNDEHTDRTLGIYIRLAHNLHLNPETKEQMLERLTEDRFTKGTVVS